MCLIQVKFVVVFFLLVKEQSDHCPSLLPEGVYLPLPAVEKNECDECVLCVCLSFFLSLFFSVIKCERQLGSSGEYLT